MKKQGWYFRKIIALFAVIILFQHINCTEDTPRPFPSVKPCPGAETVNYQGEVYPTVLIGDQCWFAKNLNAGEAIVDNSETTDNNIIEKYCYDNDTSNCNIYGGLYKWDEMMQYTNEEGSRGICPDGWHIPSNRDFVELFIYCDNYWIYLVSKDISYWTTYLNYFEHRNLLGFSALPAGAMKKDNITYEVLYKFTGFWSSSKKDDEYSYFFGIVPGRELDDQDAHKQVGLSVRCIKDQ